jgi:hypothetical protein
MVSKREQVLAALFAQLRTRLQTAVGRNEALPERVPPEGLVILRDGDPGEPDVTLNPRTEFYSHQVELEVLTTEPAGGGGEVALDRLLQEVAAALAADPSLGGLADHLRLGAPATSMLAIEGAAPILAVRLNVIVEYLVDDPLGSA